MGLERKALLQQGFLLLESETGERSWRVVEGRRRSFRPTLRPTRSLRLDVNLGAATPAGQPPLGSFGRGAGPGQYVMVRLYVPEPVCGWVNTTRLKVP